MEAFEAGCSRCKRACCAPAQSAASAQPHSVAFSKDSFRRFRFEFRPFRKRLSHRGSQSRGWGWRWGWWAPTGSHTLRLARAVFSLGNLASCGSETKGPFSKVTRPVAAGGEGGSCDGGA